MTDINCCTWVRNWAIEFEGFVKPIKLAKPDRSLLVVSNYNQDKLASTGRRLGGWLCKVLLGVPRRCFCQTPKGCPKCCPKCCAK